MKGLADLHTKLEVLGIFKDLRKLKTTIHGPGGTTADSSGVGTHAELPDVTANQHHAESHSHASHTLIGVNDHHNQSHAINGADHTGGTAVLTTDANYVDLTDGGATILHSHAAIAHNLLSTTHGDTLTGTSVRGDVIIANSTPAWAKVAGTANAVLQFTTGADTAWTTTPRLAQIKDTGGTTRLTLATSTPHVTLTGNVRMEIDPLDVGALETGIYSHDGNLVAEITSTGTSGYEGLQWIPYLGVNINVSAASGERVTIREDRAIGGAVSIVKFTLATSQNANISASFPYSIFSLTGTHNINTGTTNYTLENFYGFNFAYSVAKAAAATGGITNLTGIYFNRASTINRITNSAAIDIEEWDWGATTLKMGIRQRETVLHNRFAGATTFGADTTPTSFRFFFISI